VPLDYELQGGEIVDIVTNRAAHPTRDWLSFARTAAARNKIRRYLKTYEREINLQLGQERLDLALKAVGVSHGIAAVHDEDFATLCISRKYGTLEDIYMAIGRDDVHIETVVEHLVPLLQQRGDIVPAPHAEETAPEAEAELKQLLLPAPLDNKSGTNWNPILVKLAHCCCPIPGDAIVGVFNPGKGMTVHRDDCRMLRRYREQARERLVEVNWLQIEPQHYLAPITIVARDRAGLLRDVAAVVADAGVNMTSVASSTNASSQKAVITATLEIEAIDQMDRIFKRLRQVKNVVSVHRTLSTRAATSRRIEQ
jgi:GTP pyrophosphokinase